MVADKESISWRVTDKLFYNLKAIFTVSKYKTFTRVPTGFLAYKFVEKSIGLVFVCKLYTTTSCCERLFLMVAFYISVVNGCNGAASSVFQ